MDRIELIKLVERILSAEDTEKKLHELIELLEAHIPDPQVVNYMYSKEYEDLTPEQIVDKALSYKPFYL